MAVLKQKIERKKRRVRRVRKKIVGTKNRPRVALTQSNKHLYVQAVDDMAGKTLAYLSSLSKDIKVKSDCKKGNKVAQDLAENFYNKLQTAKVKEVVFDRRNKQYHGVIKIFADKLREKGIKF